MVAVKKPVHQPYGAKTPLGYESGEQSIFKKGIKLLIGIEPEDVNVVLGINIALKDVNTKKVTIGSDGISLGGDISPSADDLIIGKSRDIGELRTKKVTVGADGISLGGNIVPSNANIVIGATTMLAELRTKKLTVGTTGISLDGNIIPANTNIVIGQDTAIKEVNTSKLTVGTEGIALNGSITPGNANIIIGLNTDVKEVNTKKLKVVGDGFSLGSSITLTAAGLNIGSTGTRLGSLFATDIDVATLITSGDMTITTGTGKLIKHKIGTNIYSVYTTNNKPEWTDIGGDQYLARAESSDIINIVSGVTKFQPALTNTTKLGDTTKQFSEIYGKVLYQDNVRIPTITFGNGDPTGGTDRDIYFKLDGIADEKVWRNNVGTWEPIV